MRQVTGRALSRRPQAAALAALLAACVPAVAQAGGPATTPPPATPAPWVQPGALEFGVLVDHMTLTVRDTGQGGLRWAVTASAPWLTVDRKEGTGPATLTVWAARPGLGLGAHEATLAFTSNRGEATVTVRVVVDDPFAGSPTVEGVPIFPADNPWNTDISAYPVHPNSAQFIASIGAAAPLHPDFGAFWEGRPTGFQYVVVGGDQKRVPVRFDYADESDPGPYPFPPDAPIEGGPTAPGDRHVLVLDRDHRKLYETWSSFPEAGGGWHVGTGAVFDLTRDALRPDTWTSADAAGLPILPGLVRYDEVAAGEVRHAFRFTCQRTQRGFIHPATHWASRSKDPNLPPMGLRLRLRADYDLSGFPPGARVILTALKRYGMIVADNGGNWFISGAHDTRWNSDELETIKRVPGSALEAVDTGPIVTG